MRCPNCKSEVDEQEMKLERSAEEDGIEISYTCPGCQEDFYAILNPTDFIPVD